MANWRLAAPATLWVSRSGDPVRLEQTVALAEAKKGRAVDKQGFHLAFVLTADR